MITDPVFSGLAISFIFGTAASTVFTVFLIPILLTFYYKRWPYKRRDEALKNRWE